MERSEWSNNLRKLLECPICYEINNPIFLCKLGHNVCEMCMLRIDRCPICQNGFSTIRNYCVESISLMFNDLKKEFDDIEKNFKSSDLSVNKKSSLTYKFDPYLELGTAVNRSWGIFPCILETCSFKGCFDKIIQHFQNQHPEMYELILNCTLPITMRWTITYENRQRSMYNSFFLINVGFFIFHINIDQDGYLRGTILMYASRSVAKKISYHIKITDGKQIWKLKTNKTQTCRTHLNTVYATCLTVHSEKILGDSNIKTVPLTCTVVLKQQILR